MCPLAECVLDLVYVWRQTKGLLLRTQTLDTQPSMKVVQRRGLSELLKSIILYC